MTGYSFRQMTTKSVNAIFQNIEFNTSVSLTWPNNLQCLITFVKSGTTFFFGENFSLKVELWWRKTKTFSMLFSQSATCVHLCSPANLRVNLGLYKYFWPMKSREGACVISGLNQLKATVPPAPGSGYHEFQTTWQAGGGPAACIRLHLRRATEISEFSYYGS